MENIDSNEQNEQNEHTIEDLKKMYDEIVNMDKEIKHTVKDICHSGDKPLSVIKNIAPLYDEAINIFYNIWSFNYKIDRYHDLLEVHQILNNILNRDIVD